MTKKHEVVGIAFEDGQIWKTREAIYKFGLNNGKYKKLITREHAEMMVYCDSGPAWERIAKSETLFWIDDNNTIFWNKDNESGDSKNE